MVDEKFKSYQLLFIETKEMVEEIDKKIEDIKAANPKPKRRSR